MYFVQNHLTEIVYVMASSAAFLILKGMIRNIEGQMNEFWEETLAQVISKQNTFRIEMTSKRVLFPSHPIEMMEQRELFLSNFK